MAELILWIIIFGISIFVLIKASDYFTDAAETVGFYFKLPAFIVGVTIVAVGTSLPELISSIIAVLNDASEIVAANVVGSNIANVFLILGIAAIAGRGLVFHYELKHVDVPLLVASSFLFAAAIYDGIFTLAEALLLIAGFVVYLFYTLQTERKHKDVEVIRELKEMQREKKMGTKTILILLASTLAIYIGAKYTIEAVIVLSRILQIGVEIIGISAVAVGTSLPELTVSIIAARKGNAEVAVGNVLGSNIFNALIVMSVPAFFGALLIPQSIITFGLPMMLIATLLYFLITHEKEVTPWEGWFLIIFYVFFIGKLFSLF